LKPSHTILLLLMNFCWAAVYSSYKVIGHDMPSGGIVTLRFGLAGLCLLCAWPLLPGVAPKGRDLALTCLMGLLLYVLGQRLQVYGNQIGTAGNTAVLIAFEPLLVSVAAGIFLREHLGPRRLAGFCLGMLGVGLLNGLWRADFRWSGLSASLLVLGSFVFEAAYTVMGKPIVLRASAMKMLAISLLVGTAANLLIDGSSTFTAARALSPKAWALVALLAVVCTAVGYTVWFVVIRECPINVAALTVFAQSVFGVLIAAVWLGEKLRWDQLLGSMAIVAGLVVGLSRQVRREQVH
jgi:drug/metabolite transporter (DMT)-like permease